MGLSTWKPWIGALFLVILFAWGKWSVTQIETVTSLGKEIKERDDKITLLDDQIKTYATTKEDNAKWYDALNDAQVDLLCAARNKDPVVPDTSPVQIKEVIQYRDKITKCPTPDITKAEPLSIGQVMRPVNDEIGLQVLNNSWKAYCKAIGNMEDICAPFR